MKPTAEKIKVMQAFEDGAEIEVTGKPHVSWRLLTIDKPKWNWGTCNYRVAEKPPRDKWINIYGYGDHLHPTKDAAIKGAGAGIKFTAVHYRRVEGEDE